ncbi:MAG: hypothetical protein BGO25_06085 [Acidobacteriales bacterium 59-55]|nr:MAG: hypothetical protein ABT04_02025 [Granulicella sp. SCN 62-9]OJV42972.1 MAG: hypothetical protein BGO25_06085 [Acidobacteriales bacterium 59-55]
MPVPTRSYAIARLSALVLLALTVAVPLEARGPGPAFRIPLDSLGFQPQTKQFLLAGGSMLTLHYVDNSHLLLTFAVHKLMERIPDDPPGDEDRVVEAVLLETPSGRVLARTDWRFHDNGQYLWNLGHGRFMLRVRDTLTTFAPLANLASGRPFTQRGFLTTDRRIGAVLLSPEADLLVVESVERKPPPPQPKTPLFGPTPKPTPQPLGEPGDPSPVALSFYRLAIPSESGDEVEASLAGVAHSSSFGDIAATGAGHIAVVDQGKQQWGFDFRPYRGEGKQLAPFDSTCRPTPRFVSGSEFIAFGCHSGDSPMVLGGFNMKGDEMWEQNLFGDYVGTSMSFAPSSGRFALGRVLGEGSADDLQPVSADAFTGQNVAVYQTESGKQLLHVDCSPIARAGQNFALSPDGMSLAVIHEGAIEIYSLPPLSSQDAADVKMARALVPEASILPIDFGTMSRASAPEKAEPSPAASEPAPSQPATAPASAAGNASPSVPPPASAPAAAPTAPASQAQSVPAGDAEPEQPRKPPTLYTLPTDPEKKGQNKE